MADEFKHKTAGTVLTQAEYEATGGTGHIFDSQATGDIAYASSATVLSRLGIGATARVLTVESGLPAWKAEEKVVQIRVFDVGVDTATGDRKATFVVPSTLNLMNLVEVHGEVDTAGTTNTLDVQLRNVTQTADMLSTKLTIDTGETGSDTAAAAAVINTSEDDLATFDVIAIDVDAVHGTAAKGLVVTMVYRAA